MQRDKMVAALRWLLEHPSSHIGGFLAENAEGVTVTTMSPHATCFCPLGRYAREIGLDTSELMYEDYGLTAEQGAETWRTNDRAFAYNIDGVLQAKSEERRVAQLLAVGEIYGIAAAEITGEQ